MRISRFYPYLNANTTEATTGAVVVKADNADNDESDEEEEDTDKDPISAMIDTVRDLPMETRQHMLANMMFMVPMAALSMVAAGVPQLAIAPLAVLIPGFIFTAFTETGDGSTRHGGGHGHHGSHDHVEGNHNRHGLSGLIAGVRDFYHHGLDSETLHIRTRDRTPNRNKRSVDRENAVAKLVGKNVLGVKMAPILSKRRHYHSRQHSAASTYS